MTWTKVSLNEANIRATPKTSSPVWGMIYESESCEGIFGAGVGARWGIILTISNLRTKRDVLGGGALDLLLGGHCD